jgi:hypothetical protein
MFKTAMPQEEYFNANVLKELHIHSVPLQDTQIIAVLFSMFLTAHNSRCSVALDVMYFPNFYRQDISIGRHVDLASKDLKSRSNCVQESLEQFVIKCSCKKYTKGNTSPNCQHQCLFLYQMCLLPQNQSPKILNVMT